MAFDKQNFFAVNSAKKNLKALDIAEFGGTVYARTLTLGEALSLHDAVKAGKDMRGLVFVRSFCNEEGEHLFDDSDYESIMSLPVETFGKIWDALNAELLDEKSVEAERKNSEAIL